MGRPFARLASSPNESRLQHRSPLNPPRQQRIAIVGVGLIGGSLGLALRKRGGFEVLGVCRSAESVQRVIKSAVVERATTDLAEAAGWADVMVFCTPVGEIADGLAKSLANLQPGAVITDAGSTKASLVATIEAALAKDPGGAANFVGAHPLAGDHRRGPEAARADLFAGRTVVITPTASTSAHALETVERMWQTVGAKTRRMSPTEHDAALARTSHLPHLVAAALAAATPPELLPLTATGWADTTRVAAGDAALWRDIYLANSAEVLMALDELEAKLAEYRAALVANEGPVLEQLLRTGKERRDAVGS